MNERRGTVVPLLFHAANSQLNDQTQACCSGKRNMLAFVLKLNILITKS